MNNTITDQPLISIIIPTYNRANSLGIALQACIDQTHKNLEIIIVNDGSKDNTVEIAESWVEKDARIRLIDKKINEGLPKALNTGFQEAHGLYWTWTSDDNTFLPDALATMLEAAEKKGTPCLVHADYWILDDENKKQLITINSEDTFKNKNIVGACFLYHRTIGEKIGDYNPDLFLVEDMDYWMRISREFPLVHIKQPLYNYLRNASTLSIMRKTEIRLLAICIRKRYGYYNWVQFIRRFIKPALTMYFDRSVANKEKLKKFNKAFNILIRA